jgi:hypothetical protein
MHQHQLGGDIWDVIVVGAGPSRTRACVERFLARVGLPEFPPTSTSGHLTRCRDPQSLADSLAEHRIAARAGTALTPISRAPVGRSTNKAGRLRSAATSERAVAGRWC